MKANPKKIKHYSIDFIIVTAGVLIALFLNNFKENHQERKYHTASVETIKNEIEANYKQLESVIEKQKNLLDTINKYTTSDMSIGELIVGKSGGLKGTTLSNSGLEFYKKNQLNLIDFELMNKLIGIDKTIRLIDVKMEKLLDFLYPNLFVNSEESKKLTIFQLNNLLSSETYLMKQYKEFIDEYIENKK